MANLKTTDYGAINLGAILGTELFEIVQYDAGSGLWINRKVTLAQLTTLMSGGGSGWSLTGNSGTNPSSNFIGTTDTLQLAFKVGNVPMGFLDSDNGNVYWGSGAGNSSSNAYSNAIGTYAGYSSSAVSQNAIGYYAGAYANAYYQIAMGYYAGTYNSGDNQVALGQYAGYSNSQQKQVALGYYAGYGNGGQNNISIGNQAGYNNSYHEVALIGTNAYATSENQFALSPNYSSIFAPLNSGSAGYVLTNDGSGVGTWQAPLGGGGGGWSLTGNAGTNPGTNFIGTTDNVPIVFKANGNQVGVLDPGNNAISFGLGARTDGNENLFIGYNSGQGSSYGQNVYIGAQAGYGNGGNGNVGLGVSALAENGSNAYSCIAIGSDAGYGNNGYQLTTIGYASANNNSGNNLIAIGYLAGNNNTGNNADILGTNSDAYGNPIVVNYYNEVTLLGTAAIADANNQFVISDSRHSIKGNLGGNLQGDVLMSDGNSHWTPQPIAVPAATGSEPGTPYQGQFCFDTTLLKMKFWNGSAWSVLTSTP